MKFQDKSNIAVDTLTLDDTLVRANGDNEQVSLNEVKKSILKVKSGGSLTGEDITLDAANGTNFFDVYLTSPHTVLSNIQNMMIGERYIIQMRQNHIGKNHIHWGSHTHNTGLTITTIPGMGDTVILSVDAGTFDWSSLNTAIGLNTRLTIKGLTENAMNCGGFKVDGFDESTGEIYITNPFKSSLSGETATSGVEIVCNNTNYFFPEEEDNWIATNPFGVTMFECWTSGDNMVSIRKIGTHTSDTRHKAKARIYTEIVDDFVAGNDDGLLQWAEASYNGAINTSSSKVDGSHFGNVFHQLKTGNTSARTNMRLQTDAFVLNNSLCITEMVVHFEEEFFNQIGTKCYIGWNDGTNTPSSITDGYYFEVVSNGDQTGRIWCIVEKDNTRDAYDTGIDIEGEVWHSLAIQMSADFGHIHFFVNDMDVLVKVNTGGTLFTEAKITPFFGTQHSGDALTSNKHFYVDMFSLKYRINNDRI